MASKDYLPRIDSQFVIWLENFSTKLASHASTLGVAPADVSQFQTDLTTIRQKLSDVQTKKTSLDSSVESKEATLVEIAKRLRDAVVVIKRKSGYTDSIGADLGIISSSMEPTDGLPKPEFQTTILPDKVRLDWVKGNSDGVVVQSKRGNEAEYTTLGRDTISPFDDERPCLTSGTPEMRMYRVRYLRGDDEVGDWSNESRVLFVK